MHVWGKKWIADIYEGRLVFNPLKVIFTTVL